LALSGLILAAGISAAPPGAPDAAAQRKLPLERITGPFVHRNLAVFVLHGPQLKRAKPFIGLTQAMEKKLVVVHETSTVNLLQIENLSTDLEVFVQAGDIVKGGKQDRILAATMFLPTKSGRVPIPAFCVEQGRWSGRGAEAVGAFGGNRAQGGKDVKLAAAGAANQSEVWAEVAKTQELLGKRLRRSVSAAASPSSYQLSLEDKDVAARVAETERALAGILIGKPDAVGVAYAINGRVEGAELFPSAEILRIQWPKLLGSFAVDAMSQCDDGKDHPIPTVKAVEAFFAEAGAIMAGEPGRARVDAAKVSEPKKSPNGGETWAWETTIAVTIETRDAATQTPLNRSVLRKPDRPAGAPANLLGNRGPWQQQMEQGGDRISIRRGPNGAAQQQEQQQAMPPQGANDNEQRQPTPPAGTPNATPPWRTPNAAPPAATPATPPAPGGPPRRDGSANPPGNRAGS
jgi:hypothetical protein